METGFFGLPTEGVRYFRNFLRGMETKDVPVREPHGGDFRNFLRGMETTRTWPRFASSAHSFRNFLRGMETLHGFVQCLGDGPLPKLP